MRQPPQIRMLPDGRRLHLNDGPIDLIIEGFGDAGKVRAAYHAAATRFATILDELCSELPLLRAPFRPGCLLPGGVVASRMARAVAPFGDRCFITPMAAVAGSVAEEILLAMTSASNLERAYVNNGGDIAFHLTSGTQFAAGMIASPDRPCLFGAATLHFDEPVRGIATSGWHGRSFSLGIADAVTVLASTASQADAAATILANAVDLPSHAAILREPARDLAPDNDLGDILVTRFVPRLIEHEIQTALAAGVQVAEELRAANLIVSAALALQGRARIVGDPVNALPLRTRFSYSVNRSPLHA